MLDATKPYRSKNNIVKKLETNNEDVVTGYLDVSVIGDERNLPINGAEVNIYKFTIRGIDATQGEEVLIESHTTDINGKIPIVELPVIHGLNMSNETDFGRVQYHMTVDAIDYNSVTVINIEIFPDIATVYNVMMSPVAMGVRRNEFIIIPEKHYI